MPSGPGNWYVFANANWSASYSFCTGYNNRSSNYENGYRIYCGAFQDCLYYLSWVSIPTGYNQCGMITANYVNSIFHALNFYYLVDPNNGALVNGTINIVGYSAIKETETSYVKASTASGYVYSDNPSAYPDQTYTMDDSGDYWWYVRVD